MRRKWNMIWNILLSRPVIYRGVFTGGFRIDTNQMKHAVLFDNISQGDGA